MRNDDHEILDGARDFPEFAALAQQISDLLRDFSGKYDADEVQERAGNNGVAFLIMLWHLLPLVSSGPKGEAPDNDYVKLVAYFSDLLTAFKRNDTEEIEREFVAFMSLANMEIPRRYGIEDFSPGLLAMLSGISVASAVGANSFSQTFVEEYMEGTQKILAMMLAKKIAASEDVEFRVRNKPGDKGTGKPGAKSTGKPKRQDEGSDRAHELN